MTITLILGILVVVLATVLVLDKLEQRSKRRDREIVRRFQKYMAQLPPARPW